MSNQAPRYRLPLWANAVIWVVAFGVVMAVSWLVISSNEAAEQADFEARSGSAALELSGESFNDQMTITSARIITEAEYDTTTIELQVRRNPDAGIRYPAVRIELAETTCGMRSRLWSNAIENTLTLRCDTVIPHDELDAVGVATVDLDG